MPVISGPYLQMDYGIGIFQIRRYLIIVFPGRMNGHFKDYPLILYLEVAIRNSIHGI
ncbi:MAG: hypothetical protein K0B08_00235 [Bacteroidales bacterium]|nr:hypothetical protein [Bacteroidales bacterium]